MTYPEKIAYLYRYRDALRREKTIADEIEALRAEAARVTQALTGMPGGGDGQAIPRAVERIAADHNVTLRWAAKQHHRTVDAMEISPENPERVP